MPEWQHLTLTVDNDRGHVLTLHLVNHDWSRDFDPLFTKESDGIGACAIGVTNIWVRKLPRQVDSSKLEVPRRSIARGSALGAGFPARRAA